MWFALGANKIIVPFKGMSIINREEDIPKLIDRKIARTKKSSYGVSTSSIRQQNWYYFKEFSSRF